MADNVLSLFVGIDLGTSGVRACVINNKNELLYTFSTLLPPPIIEQKSITQDAGLWWQATLEVLNQLFEVIDATQVQAISVNGTSGTVLVCDPLGVPLSPARMYNDAFCSEQAVRIKSIAPAESAAHGSSSGLAKLLYLQALYPQAKHLLHQADWVSGQLCGCFKISDENNALKTGYDPIKSQWPDWFADLNVRMELLPEVFPPGTPIATVRAELFKEHNLNPDCQIIRGTTDSIAAFIATGANKPGDAVTSLGSTLVLKVLSEKPVSAPEYGIYSHKLGDYWLAGGASNTGGAVLKYYFTQQKIDELSLLLKPDQSTDLNYYPLIQAGERFPVNDPELQPRLEPKADSELKFFQGLLEGISKIELEGYKKLQQLGAPYPNQIETAGGGSKNAGWTKIRQNLMGVSVLQADFSEACYGSALLAKRGSAV